MIRRKAMVAIIAALLGGGRLVAWDWPLVNPQVMVDFASDFRGGFLTGMILRSEDPSVVAVQDGELVLSAQEGRPARQRFPLAFGGTLLMEHANGMRSVYTGFPSGFGSTDRNRSTVENWKLVKGAVLGRLASTGQNGSAALFFRLIDNVHANAVNPQVVLRRLVDERVPIISAVQIEPEQTGLRISLSDRLDIPQASFKLFVRLWDSPGRRQSLAGRPLASPSLPYEIKVIWNGELAYESGKVALRRADGQAGPLRMIRNKAGGYLFLYQPDGFVAIGEFKLADGVNRLEIRAADLNGNRTSASWRLLHPVRQP